jgi:hypothetical protein
MPLLLIFQCLSHHSVSFGVFSDLIGDELCHFLSLWSLCDYENESC